MNVYDLAKLINSVTQASQLIATSRGPELDLTFSGVGMQSKMVQKSVAALYYASFELAKKVNQGYLLKQIGLFLSQTGEESMGKTFSGISSELDSRALDAWAKFWWWLLATSLPRVYGHYAAFLPEYLDALKREDPILLARESLLGGRIPNKKDRERFALHYVIAHAKGFLPAHLHTISSTLNTALDVWAVAFGDRGLHLVMLSQSEERGSKPKLNVASLEFES